MISPYRWTRDGSPCTAPAKADKPRGPRCGLPRRLADAPHGGQMGLHPADDPGAPAGGWQCEAGHMDWILTREVVEDDRWAWWYGGVDAPLAEILAPAIDKLIAMGHGIGFAGLAAAAVDVWPPELYVVSPPLDPPESTMSHRNISITLPEPLLIQIDTIAEEETRNRSQQIAHLLGVALSFRAKPNPHAGATGRYLEKLRVEVAAKLQEDSAKVSDATQVELDRLAKEAGVTEAALVTLLDGSA